MLNMPYEKKASSAALPTFLPSFWESVCKANENENKKKLILSRGHKVRLWQKWQEKALSKCYIPDFF